jgi:hypothetical protein
MTTTPLTPNGLNSWKTTSTIVACARLAASISALHGLDVVDGVQIAIEQLEKQVSTQGVQSSRPPFVSDHLPHVSCDALHSVSSLSAARILPPDQKLIHCRVAILRLQEKNTSPSLRRRRVRRRAAQFSLALVGGALQSDK